MREYFDQVNDDTRHMNQVVEVLYRVAEVLHFGPPIQAPAISQKARSPGSGIEYQRWSDGKVYYSLPGEKKKYELVLGGMTPHAANQKAFRQDHWVDPRDLRIDNMIFDNRNLMMLRRARRSNPVVEARDIRNGETYQFNFDEQNGLLILVGKNKRRLEAPLVYLRRNEDDERRGADAARYQGPSVLKKVKPEPDSGYRGVPLTRWTSAR